MRFEIDSDSNKKNNINKTPISKTILTFFI